MRKFLLALGAIIGIWGSAGLAAAQADPNLAMNNPDEQAWELFLIVNATAATQDNNNALFETWASDGDTFRPTPTWPGTSSPGAKNGPRALGLVAQRAHGGMRIQVVPGGTALVGEETRRNRVDFDFIVSNTLYKISGLKAAYTAAKPISFPIDSVEVKANWVEVGRLKEFNGFTGSPADAARAYHVNSAEGKQYALVSFHVISKLVPNWTWATWEHKDNPGRCDVIGCKDSFGAQTPWVPPLSRTESNTRYPDCVKSPDLLSMLGKAKIDSAFANYCLKGSQADFTDPSGLAVRLGNSVTESGFVNQASCMSCHGRAGFDSSGHPTSFAGFDILSPNLKIGAANNTGAAPVGPINPAWYWWAPQGPPSSPALADRTSVLARVSLPADFVWSIPFCAIDDTAQPPQTQSRFCAHK